jgi:hypothetical protein
MFDLYIPITSATIDTIKEYLWDELPSVKSTHRLEAIARGLGFRTYAAMLESAKSVLHTLCKPDGTPFASYLRDHGFHVETAHIYRAVARAAVSIVLADTPRLSARGYGFRPPQWDAEKKRRQTAEEQYKDFAQNRQELLSTQGLDEFLLAFAVCQRIPQTKTIRADANSYRLKHIAENMPYVCADGTELGPRYVSNGAFIAAALRAGFKMKTYLDHLGYDHINVSFNMPKRVINILGRETRSIQ